jgi:hypothetical protein
MKEVDFDGRKLNLGFDARTLEPRVFLNTKVEEIRSYTNPRNPIGMI